MRIGTHSTAAARQASPKEVAAPLLCPVFSLFTIHNSQFTPMSSNCGVSVAFPVGKPRLGSRSNEG
jgi:hypothetical protein